MLGIVAGLVVTVVLSEILHLLSCHSSDTRTHLLYQRLLCVHEGGEENALTFGTRRKAIPRTQRVHQVAATLTQKCMSDARGHIWAQRGVGFAPVLFEDFLLDVTTHYALPDRDAPYVVHF